MHEKIRLEELMVSTLKRGDSHFLRTVTLESPLLVSLPTEEETLAVLSRSDDCAGWGLGLVGTEDTGSRLPTILTNNRGRDLVIAFILGATELQVDLVLEELCD